MLSALFDILWELFPFGTRPGHDSDSSTERGVRRRRWKKVDLDRVNRR